MNRFTPFINQPGRRTGFYDGLVCAAAAATLLFAGGYACLLTYLAVMR
jgi:hypothetical protein